MSFSEWIIFRTSGQTDLQLFEATLIGVDLAQYDIFALQFAFSDKGGINLNFHYTPVLKLTLSLPETNISEFANSVDLDEVAHNEPPHQDLHCLPSSL